MRRESPQKPTKGVLSLFTEEQFHNQEFRSQFHGKVDEIVDAFKGKLGEPDLHTRKLCQLLARKIQRVLSNASLSELDQVAAVQEVTRSGKISLFTKPMAKQIVKQRLDGVSEQALAAVVLGAMREKALKSCGSSLKNQIKLHLENPEMDQRLMGMEGQRRVATLFYGGNGKAPAHSVSSLKLESRQAGNSDETLREKLQWSSIGQGRVRDVSRLEASQDAAASRAIFLPLPKDTLTRDQFANAALVLDDFFALMTTSTEAADSARDVMKEMCSDPNLGVYTRPLYLIALRVEKARRLVRTFERAVGVDDSNGEKVLQDRRKLDVILFRGAWGDRPPAGTTPISLNIMILFRETSTHPALMTGGRYNFYNGGHDALALPFKSTLQKLRRGDNINFDALVGTLTRSYVWRDPINLNFSQPPEAEILRQNKLAAIAEVRRVVDYIVAPGDNIARSIIGGLSSEPSCLKSWIEQENQRLDHRKYRIAKDYERRLKGLDADSILTERLTKASRERRAGIEKQKMLFNELAAATIELVDAGVDPKVISWTLTLGRSKSDILGTFQVLRESASS